jgi:hypothetical protein
MNSHSEIMPITGAAAINSATLKNRLFTLCYLTAVAVATLGWLAALGWTAFALAQWSFF